VTGGFPQRYGRDRIAEEVDAQINAANPTVADVQTWLGLIPQYELVRMDPKAGPLAELANKLEELKAAVKPQTLTEAEHGQYAAERSAVEGKLAALAGERFVRKHVAQFRGEIPGGSTRSAKT
jgi:hypothetical protein